MQFNKNNKGFTLVEMIVSLGIFSVVAVVALGALVRIISANKKAQTLHLAVSSLSSALESMSHEIRVGTDYKCIKGNPIGTINSATAGKACSINNDPNVMFAFKSTKVVPGGCAAYVVYKFSPVNTPVDTHYVLQKAEEATCGAGITNPGSFRNLISDTNVILEDFTLGVGPNSGGNFEEVYPYVYIRLKGYAGDKEKIRTRFDVQTTVSSRSSQ